MLYSFRSPENAEGLVALASQANWLDLARHEVDAEDVGELWIFLIGWFLESFNRAFQVMCLSEAV